VTTDAVTTDAVEPGSRRVAIVRCRDVYELQVRREADAFTEAGCDVDVIMLAGTGGEAGVTEVDGVRVHRLVGAKSRGSKLQYFADYGSFLARVARLLHREGARRPFDLVQINTMPDFLVLATLLERRRGTKVTVFFKEPTPELGYTIYGSNLVRRALLASERLASRLAHASFTVTPELRQTYIDRGSNGERVHVVLNGTDLRHFGGGRVEPRRDPDRFVAICHGTIEHRYGHDVMLEAIRLVRDRVPNVQLRIIGTGDYVDEVKRQIDAHDLADHVVFLGWLELEEVVAEVAGADVGIVAQLSSPYSNLVHTNKMFEYIMLGVPCIASRLHSVSKAFDDTQVEFYAADDAAALADSLERLATDPARRAELVENARKAYEAGYEWADQKQVLVRESLALLR
jgi:glycosyltransferase involved in cell wall biosynthesis